MPLKDVLIGGSVSVETIHGVVEMKISPGSQPGDLKRLKGKGIISEQHAKTGDHLVRLKVEIPTYRLSFALTSINRLHPSKFDAAREILSDSTKSAESNSTLSWSDSIKSHISRIFRRM